ncbi:MAG: hypothetical protein ACETV1_04870 [Candidatus Bathyarchaeia archaeon]
MTEILSQSFSLYSARFIQFFIPFLATGLVTGIVSLSFPFPTLPELDPGAPMGLFWQWLFDFLRTFIVTMVLIGSFSWIVRTLVNGVAVRYASDLLEKGEASLREGFSFTISRLISLLVAGIITGILMAVGFVCLIVPGFILMIMFALVTPVIMIERIGALDSLGRSRSLVSNRWGKTFAVYILISIINIIITVMAGIIVRPLDLVGSIITSIIAAVIQPVLPIATTFLYTTQ